MAEGALVRFENIDGIGVITVDNPPVNALSPGVPEGIVENVERGNADPAIKAMVLIGAGRSFIAGADIRQFGTRRPPPVPGKRTHEVLDASAKPVVAAIHGYALGAMRPSATKRPPSPFGQKPRSSRNSIVLIVNAS